MKRTMLVWVVVCLVSLTGAVGVMAQSASSADAEGTAAPKPVGASTAPGPSAAPTAVSVLRLIKFSGSAADTLGRPLQGTVGVTFALYADQQDGSPLWVETQNVTLDNQGHYTALLGATSNDGLPLEIFASGEARWLGVEVQGQAERPRVLLVAVPYALKAAEAETLSGKKASDFVTSEQLPEQVKNALQEQKTDSTSVSQTTTGEGSKAVVTSGATNFTDTTTDQVVKVTQNGTGYALLGVGKNSNGIFGATQAANASFYGLFGQTIGEKGGALIGFANSTTGTAVGVQGVSKSATGTAGVFVNTAGGTILLGRGASNAQVFSVGGAGNITSHGFMVTPDAPGVNGQLSLNVIAGSPMNNVTAGVIGATIAGGGETNGPNPNLVSGDFGTVGGGKGNTVSGLEATVAGGAANTANDNAATVGGGSSNTAGFFATVPGGSSNTATGQYSFAAGRKAQALHNGSFVWGDDIFEDFASTAENQFLIRARGGVGIGTNAPTSALEVSSASSALMKVTNDGTGTDHSALIDFKTGDSTAGSFWRMGVLGNGNGANAGEIPLFPGEFILETGGSVRIFFETDGTAVFRGNVTAATFIESSSRRWKKNIRTLEGSLDRVLRLRGVSYDQKSDGQHRIGVIAEEVGAVVPEVVSWEANGVDAKGVDYSRLTALLIEAVKDQQGQIQTEAAEVETLKAELAKDEVLLEQVRTALTTKSHVEVASATGQ